MGRTRYKIVDGAQPHFLTCTIVAWLPVFTRPEMVDIVLNSWRYLQTHDRLIIYGYVILENHLHLIASAEDLSKEIGDFKSYTARQIIDLLIRKEAKALLDQLKFYKARHKIDREYQLWQEGNHPQMIQGDEMMRQKLEYTHLNPVKRGYVDEAWDWRYSSARNYEGRGGLLPVTMEW